MQIERCTYFVPVNQVKTNGEKLNQKDLINLGYLAGRCGVNLDGWVLMGHLKKYFSAEIRLYV